MNELQPHQQRVVDEATGLSGKLIKLLLFIDKSSTYQDICSTQQALLRVQAGAMHAYLEVLNLRTEAF